MIGLWLVWLVGCGEGWLFSGTETEDDPSYAAGDSDTDDTDDTDAS